MASLHTPALLDRAAAGERLYFDEALHLCTEADLSALGAVASILRRRHVPGRLVTYVVGRTVSYTNVCVTNCQFCGFSRQPGHPEAFVCTRDELAQQVEELLQVGGTRLLLQGGHNPDLSLDWYTSILGWLQDTYPEIERDCFSPSEVAHLASISKLSVREVLRELKAAGLQGLPGEGAEILDDAIRSRFAPKKQKTESWLTVMREAQKLELNTTATMVIGFGETPNQRMRHLQRLRDLQDYSLRTHGNGFHAFVLWTLQCTEGSSLARSQASACYGATVEAYLRQAAIARIFLDNIAHHEANWSVEGPQTAQAALAFGLDDLGSTMLQEPQDVGRVPGYQRATALAEIDVHELIRSAGYTPARRDSAYNLLQVFDGPVGISATPPIEPHTAAAVALAHNP